MNLPIGTITTFTLQCQGAVALAGARGPMVVVTAAANPAVRWKADRAFFLCMGLAILGENVVGFGRAFLKTDIASELHSDWVKVHALAFAAWLIVFVAQATLIAIRRPDLHRRLGVAAIALAVLMVGLTVGSGVSGFLHGPRRTALEHVMMDVSVHVDMFIFTGFAAAGLLLRHRPEFHKRLMLLATMAVGLRWPPFVVRFLMGVTLPHYCEQIGYVLIAILFERLVLRRVNPVFLVGLAVFLVVPAGVDWLFETLVPQLAVRTMF